MTERKVLKTYDKVLALNLDQSKYGVFAEIGAGQETANWFFRVSASAGTVAKTISAYDMTMSDWPLRSEIKRRFLHFVTRFVPEATKIPASVMVGWVCVFS